MKRSTFRIRFYIKRNNPKKNGTSKRLHCHYCQFEQDVGNIRAKASMHYNRLMDDNGYVLPDQIKNSLFGLEEKCFQPEYKYNAWKAGTHEAIIQQTLNSSGSYSKYIPPEKHKTGKDNTWKIERKNLNFRTHLKRLGRKTVCFSKNETVHDNVIGMYIERYYYKTGTRK